MSQQTQDSLYETLRKSGQLLEVEMNDLQILLPSALTGTNKRAIGTKDLNGCSCVVILGETAIILAHISLYAVHHLGYQTGGLLEQISEQHEEFMAKVASMLKEHADHFPRSSTAWGVFSCGIDIPGPMETVVQQVKTRLNAIGYVMKPAFYQVVAADTMEPPKGEVVSYFNKGIAELYLERRKLWPQQQPTLGSASISQASTSQASTSQASTSQASTSQASTSQATTQGQWRGYKLKVNAQVGTTLDCVVLDQDCELNVTWPEGQQYPMVWLWNDWIQTEHYAVNDTLCVRYGNGIVEIKKRQA